MKRGCTQCGECLNVCPVFQVHKREEFAPKGKRLLLEPVDAGEAAMPWEEVKELARLCAGCGKCKLACARKLSTADLLADVRSKNPHWTQHLWELWIRRMGVLWPTLGRVSCLVPEGLTPKSLHSSLNTAKAMVEKFKPKPWVRLYKNIESSLDTSKPVVIFSGCTANNIRKGWTKKASRLLKAFGYTVLDGKDFSCCGGTLHHAGQYDAMQEVRSKNTEVWKNLGKPQIAVFCASCHHGLEEYADCLQGTDVKIWQNSLLPLSKLLTGAKAEKTEFCPQVYGYHQPCHWGNTDPDLPWLKLILPEVQKGTGLCCGMGGILKMTDPDLSAKMAEGCVTGFGSDVKTVLTGCSGCVLQLSAFSDRPVVHWLDIMEC